MSNKEVEVVNKLTEMEKNELKDVTKAYSEEEYETIIKVIPDDYLWDELIRRNTSMIKGVDFIAETFGVSLDNIAPVSARAWSEIRSRYDDLKDKFSKIRKFSGGNFE